MLSTQGNNDTWSPLPLFVLFSFFLKSLFFLEAGLFKVLSELVAILICFMFCLLAEVCGICSSHQGFEPIPALEDEVLTTGQSGKSLEGASC